MAAVNTRTTKAVSTLSAIRLALTLAVRFYERLRNLRANRIPRSPQEAHSAGNPMSQRENAGFNAPRFSVAAGDEAAG